MYVHCPQRRRRSGKRRTETKTKILNSCLEGEMGKGEMGKGEVGTGEMGTGESPGCHQNWYGSVKLNGGYHYRLDKINITVLSQCNAREIGAALSGESAQPYYDSTALSSFCFSNCLQCSRISIPPAVRPTLLVLRQMDMGSLTWVHN